MDNYYDEDFEEIEEKLRYKRGAFISKLKITKADRIITGEIAKNSHPGHRSTESDKLTPLHLLKAIDNTRIWNKIMNKYLPNTLTRHPASVFDIITPFDEEAKKRLDEWMLKLLDGPELYHILGLIELPITIAVPSDIHRSESLLAFHIFSESFGEYSPIPGFMSRFNEEHRVLERYHQLMGFTRPTISGKPSSKPGPNQYRRTLANTMDDIDPMTLHQQTSLLFSPIDSSYCFSYAHSSTTSTPIRSAISIPSYSGELSAWRPLEDLQTTCASVKIELDRDEIELILICDAVLHYYKKLREVYIGPNKPGAFQLLKDWMLYDLPEEGREQALYLTNYAIARSLIYSVKHWPNTNSSLYPRAIPDVYVENIFCPSWTHLAGYFQQLMNKFTLEDIPRHLKSSVYWRFMETMKQEKEAILKQNLSKNEDLWKLSEKDTHNLPRALAIVEILLDNIKQGLLFSSIYSGVLVGKVPGVYITNTKLLCDTLKEIKVGDERIINFKPNLRNNYFNTKVDCEGMKEKSDIVDGLMTVLYDLTIGWRMPPRKSRFFDNITKENSISVLP